MAAAGSPSEASRTSETRWLPPQLVWFMAIYAAVLLLLAPRLTLWLDEVLTLIGATQPTLADMMENLRYQQGATPLAFLTPRWAVQLFGFSELTARLPSILGSVASLPAMYWLARYIGLRFPMLAVATFALWPLQFRYALEVRPYALALCLGTWATVVFLAPWRSAAMQWIVYTLLIVAMVLAHPYSLFLPAAHLAWAAFFDRKRAAMAAASFAIAAVVIFPWYAHFRPTWLIVTQSQNLTGANARAIYVFLHEIAGSGYFGTVVLLTGVGLGMHALWRSGSIASRWFWLLAALLPILIPPFANIVFSYFYAIRQVIYAVPAMVLLFAVGAESRIRIGGCLATAFLIASIVGDVKLFTRPREDWRAAADFASQQVAQGACFEATVGAGQMLRFFRPDLETSSCANAGRVVFGSGAFDQGAPIDEAHARLTARGLTRQSERAFDGPLLEVFAK